MSSKLAKSIENTEVRFTKPGKLSNSKIRTIVLLSIGTFLEYFDLLLYVHLAVLLNELFFPQSDPTSAYLLSAFAFASTFVLRPVGGFIIGRIGDIAGRTLTIMLTTFIMAGTCLTMALIGTYEEIGITATVVVIICRMLQGFSSLGEIMGATVYLCETLKSPYKYIAVSIIGVGSRIGGMVALTIAYFSLSPIFNCNWRTAFFIGSGIAVIGTIARTTLRETPEFIDHKHRLKKKAEKDEQYVTREEVTEIKEKTDKKAVLGLFFTGFCGVASFYLTYVYFSHFAKNSLGMSPDQIMNHNLKISVLSIFCTVAITYLYKKYHPINIVKITIYITIAGLLFAPYLLTYISYDKIWLLFCLQCAIYFLTISNIIHISMWIKHFPIDKRFTIIGTTQGVASALGYGVFAFALIPLTSLLGYYGIWVICMPFVTGSLWGINYLQKLEIKLGLYYKYPYEKPAYKDTAAKEEDFSYNLPSEYDAFHGECEYSIKLINKIKKLSETMNPTINIKLIEKAIYFAKKWHHGQMRKIGNIPFYSHPLQVAGYVAKNYLKTDVIVAAILHDVVEDSSCTVEIIEKEFNSRIAEMVDRLTKIRYIDGSKIKMSFQETIDKLDEYNDYESTFIKLCDRTHNLETIEGLKEEKQEKMAKETNNFLVGVVARVADKLGIDNKIQLEEDLYAISHNILKTRSNN